MAAKARLTAALLAAALAGCATRPPAGPPPVLGTAEPGELPTRLPAPLAPADYLRRAASYDLLVVRAAALAEERSGDPALRALAERLAEDHRGLAAQLSLAGRRLNLLPGATLLPAHQQRLDALAASTRFDPDWHALMRLVHQQSYAVHAAFAERGDSPTLRAVAANAARTEREHWALLR